MLYILSKNNQYVMNSFTYTWISPTFDINQNQANTNRRETGENFADK